MKDYFSMLKKLMLFFAFMALTSNVFAQQEITGQVLDADGDIPIPGVTVSVKGTTTATITDLNGNFKIMASPEDFIVFSYIGYDTQEIAVGNQTVIKIKMKESDIGLEEVVVIGYGTVKKDDATGSVTAVSAKDFNQGNITSPEELLMGKASGVVITAPTGQPGAGATIRIRGGSSLRASNEPLIVIDGIPVDNSGLGGVANPLSSINPNDIETFTVLKDASATAIYGSRASNGVIIITTKKGKKGKLTAAYNGNFSLGVPVKYMDVYSGDEFRNLIYDRVTNYGLNPEAVNVLGNADTDWQKEIYQNAFSQDHNASVSGAINEIVPYRISLGYTNQNGILKNTNMQRSTFDVSLNPKLLDDALEMDINAKGTYFQNDFSNSGAIGAALSFDPTQPIKNGNTRYGGYTAWTELSSGDPLNGAPNNIATHNPVAQLEFRDNTSTAQRYLLNGKFSYKMPFMPELKATLNVGYDYYNTNGDDITDTLASWSYREPERQIVRYTNTRKNSLLNFYLTYTKDFGKNHLDVMGGYEYQHYYYEGETSNRPWAMTNGEYLNSDTIVYKNENFIVSFLGRANYSYDNKYFLTATVRYDGSSRFAKENRWGLFPSFAAAWKINEEAFMANADFISNLKLRAGWGVTGQQDIFDNPYPYIPTYTISQQGAYYQFGNQFYPTLRPDAYDANIKWEETTTMNFGLDFGILNDRISGSFNYYNRETTDLINEIPIAAGTNFSNFLLTNVGSLTNKGFEFEVNARAISNENMSWEVSVNYTYNENKITKLTLVDDPDYTGYETGGISGGVGNYVQINSVGYPANTFFLFRQVYDANGMPIEGLYVDKTGNGGNVSGNNANKYYVHNPAPDHMIGLSSRLTYKQFDFSFSGRISLGNYVYNNNASNMALYQNVYNQSGYTANILKDVEKTNFMTAQYWSDFYLENASFFRMDNISAGYSFNKLFTNKITGRVGFTVQNAFVITNYSGIDPEVDGGIDNNIFPRPRTFMLSLNLNF